MGKVCKGGFLDGMPVYTVEDRNQCINGGGSIVDAGGSGGCAASSAAVMPLMHGQGEAVGGNGDHFSMRPFRRIRKLMGDDPLIQELLRLNQGAAQEVERVTIEDTSFREELVSTMATLANLADAVTSAEERYDVYDEEMHARVMTLGQHLVERTEDEALQEKIQSVLRLADAFVGKSAAEIGTMLNINGAGRRSDLIDEVATPIAREFPSTAVVAAAQGIIVAVPIGELAGIHDALHTDIVFDRAIFARRAINEKAEALGALAGSATGDLESVPGGYRRRYEGVDIYYSEDDGAHEVHGEIRAKYNALGGANGPLGLPVTDETGTPDGIGRFNHFKHGGSIYWTPRTGPMMVRGVIRNLWASQGWENGPMGYPIADEYRLPPLFASRDNPDVAWSRFENGDIFSKANAVAPALAAEISSDALKGLIRTFFDRGLHAASDDLGLEARVDLVGVSEWGYNFWRSSPRTITYRLFGFHDNGLLPDTTFEIEIRLRFTLASSPSFLYPSHVSLVAALDWLRVVASGLGSGEASSSIFNGINGTFYRGGPDPHHPEVPDGAIFLAGFPTGVDHTGTGNIDVLDVLTTAQGSLQILVNPLPPSFGAFRRTVAQGRIDAFLEGF